MVERRLRCMVAPTMHDGCGWHTMIPLYILAQASRSNLLGRSSVTVTDPASEDILYNTP